MCRCTTWCMRVRESIQELYVFETVACFVRVYLQKCFKIYVKLKPIFLWAINIHRFRDDLLFHSRSVISLPHQLFISMSIYPRPRGSRNKLRATNWTTGRPKKATKRTFLANFDAKLLLFSLARRRAAPVGSRLLRRCRVHVTPASCFFLLGILSLWPTGVDWIFLLVAPPGFFFPSFPRGETRGKPSRAFHVLSFFFLLFLC